MGITSPGLPLAAAAIELPGVAELSGYALDLLSMLGAPVGRPRDLASDLSAGQAWARSGGMALTGVVDGPPQHPGWDVARAMEGAGQAYLALSRAFLVPIPVDGAALLGERAALTGATRRGSIAPGESCRLLRASDGWLAVNLARTADIELLPAWLEVPVKGTRVPWDDVGTATAEHPAKELEARAALLGLPVGRLPTGSERDVFPPPFTIHDCGTRGKSPRRPIVVDLSSLWAGPLCANLLGLAGARVVKVESTSRPDGARFGRADFFDLLHAGHESVALDFETRQGRKVLRQLLRRADVVIESSRPRALERLGIDAPELVEHGATWISITAYGRSAGSGSRVGFGDDVGVSAGLVAGQPGAPIFCSDAIADPVVGLHAAVAGLACLVGGGGYLVELSMRDSLRHAMGRQRGTPQSAVRLDAEHWVLERDGERVVVEPPHARSRVGRARPLGADTDGVLCEMGNPAWA